MKQLCKRCLLVMVVVSGFCGLFGIGEALALEQTPQKRSTVLDNTVISINLKSANPIDFFKEIQNKTNLYFVYNTADLKRLGTITCNHASISVKALLDNILVSRGLTYELSDDKVIVIKPNTQASATKRATFNGSVFANQQPLANVAVSVKGTSQGTTTNADGDWQLTVDRTGEITFVFSFIGYKTREYIVRQGDTELNRIIVDMPIEEQQIDDIIITGYEKIDKRKLTGSVASILGADLIEPTGTSIDKMLQGKLAGVSVTQNTSTPGAAPKIRIRGNSTILGNREPVWVVDGIIIEDPVQVSAAELNSLDRVNLVGNAISFLNPEDIERIDVLKDVSATAIYGVKAANGVVVVTTKRGKSGSTNISYAGNLSVKGHPTYNRLNLMNSSERVDVSLEIEDRGLKFGDVSSPNVGYEGLLKDYWDRKISYEELQLGTARLRSNNTDWFGLLFRPQISQSHSLSLSGGSDKAQYYVSGSYANDKDAQLNTGLDRLTLNTRLTFNIRHNMTLNVGLSVSNQNTKRNHSSLDLLSYAYSTSRTINAYQDDGSLAYYPNAMSQMKGEQDYIYFNIFNEIEHSGDSENVLTAKLNVNFDYKITPWLSSSTIFGYDLSSASSDSWADEQSFYISEKRGTPYGVIMPDDVKSQTRLPFGGELVEGLNKARTYNIRESIIANKRLGNHFFEAQVGTEIRSSRYLGSNHTTYGYLPDRGKKVVDVDLNEFPEFMKIVGGNKPIIRDNTSNTVSMFGIIRYDIMDRYMFNFNIRYDGSNKFGQSKHNRFLPVWSVSGRWNITSEPFMENVTFIDDLGLKASYGLQGNVLSDQSPNMLATLGGLDANTQQYISLLNAFPNPNLKWEMTHSSQVGVDFGLFNGILSGTFEYYYKIGLDQIITRTIEPTNGVEQVMINGGTLINKGWEVGVNVRLLNTRDWKWTVSANVSRNENIVRDSENKVVEYSDYVNGQLLVNNMSLNSFYSYRFAGLDNNTGLPTFDGLTGNYATFQDALNGAFLYSGRRDPLMTGGFTTGLKYKQLSFAANFAYALGHKVRLAPLYKESGQQLPMPNQNWSRDFVDRWQKPGDKTDIPVLSDQTMRLTEFGYGYAVADNFWQMYNQADHRVVSGNYLRCTSASLRYSFGDNVLKKIGAKGMDVGFTCNNLFVIADKRLNGQDPEQMAAGSRVIPPQRTYSFSLGLNF